ncbi:MAG: RNA methyltransferase [Promethearchaeota archaeon]
MDKKKFLKELESFKETYIDEKYKNLSFTIILIRPEHAGNIGSIARVMENFAFNDLVIFNPIEKIKRIKNYKSQGFAMHGKNILLNAEIIKIKNQNHHIVELKKFLRPYDLVIGTTAKGMRYTNLKRLSVFPDFIKLPISEKKLKIAILFGKESRGLTNEEIALSDILLRIPANNKYPTLNISHACGIILYEIFKKINILNLGRGTHPILLADKKDRQIIYNFVQKISDKLRIRCHKEENTFLAFKNVLERAFMTKKELSLMTGLFSKIFSILKDLNLYKT